MQVTRREFFIHVVVWMLFIVLEISLKSIQLKHFPSLQFTFYYLFNIAFFYLFILVYKIAFSKASPYFVSAILQITSIGIFIIGYLLIGELILMLKNEPTTAIATDDVFYGFWRSFYFWGFATAYFFAKYSIQQEKIAHQRNLQLLEAKTNQAVTEAELIKSQNEFLKAQINSHLLFNVLNFLHQDIAQRSPGAEEPIMILSDVMHYALVDVREDGKVFLREELEAVKRYVALNRLLHSEKLQLQLTIETGNRYDQSLILPLILLPFVENTFKYADLNRADDPAIISITCSEGFLHLHLANRKIDSPYAKSHGIGINNIKNRLAKHYLPENFSIEITDMDTYFELDFKFKL